MQYQGDTEKAGLERVVEGVGMSGKETLIIYLKLVILTMKTEENLITENNMLLSGLNFLVPLSWYSLHST